MKFLLAYYRPHLTKIIFVLLFMLPNSSISLLFPMLTGDLIDGIMLSKGVDGLYTIGGIFLSLLVAQAIIGYILSITLATITEKVVASLRLDVFNHVIRTPLAYLSGKRVGDLTSRLSSDLALVQETFSFSVLQLIRQSIFLIGSVTIIVATSVQLTIPILLVTPLVVLIAVLLGRKIRGISKQTQEALSVTATIAEETLQSVNAVKSYVREAYEGQRYSTALQENVNLAIKGARLRAAFVTFIIFVIFGGIAAVIIYGASLVGQGNITMGELLSFLMYAMFVGGALGSFAELFGQIQKSMGAAERIEELFQVEAEDLGLDESLQASESQQHNVTQTEPSLIIANIQLDNVWFDYADREDHAVLRGINLQINKGQRVAFVGKSGAGKSTTAALIQRLYEPVQGQLLFNNQPSNSYSLYAVRNAIGIVPQDVVLLGGTIADNIRYGDLTASEQKIESAAKDANALDFIQSFPEGFETLVGERGMKLSGGQRQRIAIARALLKNPSVLILDEATSALDAESEGLVQEAMQRLMHGRTAIIIAHRLSTVRSADLIAVFEDGRIVEQGNHEELLKIEDGRYRYWCDLQFIS